MSVKVMMAVGPSECTHEEAHYAGHRGWLITIAPLILHL